MNAERTNGTLSFAVAALVLALDGTPAEADRVVMSLFGQAPAGTPSGAVEQVRRALDQVRAADGDVPGVPGGKRDLDARCSCLAPTGERCPHTATAGGRCDPCRDDKGCPAWWDEQRQPPPETLKADPSACPHAVLDEGSGVEWGFRDCVTCGRRFPMRSDDDHHEGQQEPDDDR